MTIRSLRTRIKVFHRLGFVGGPHRANVFFSFVFVIKTRTIRDLPRGEFSFLSLLGETEMRKRNFVVEIWKEGNVSHRADVV